MTNSHASVTQAQEELEQKRLEERKAEEAELSKKFKATPAPAHIYMPLYDDITEQQETKRRLNHQYREELLRYALVLIMYSFSIETTFF